MLQQVNRLQLQLLVLNKYYNSYLGEHISEKKLAYYTITNKKMSKLQLENQIKPFFTPPCQFYN